MEEVMSLQNLSPKEESLLSALCKMFDRPNEARKLVTDNMRNGRILFTGSGNYVPLSTFFLLHKSAYLKRIQSKTPHNLSILKLSIRTANPEIVRRPKRAQRVGM